MSRFTTDPGFSADNSLMRQIEGIREGFLRNIEDIPSVRICDVCNTEHDMFIVFRCFEIEVFFCSSACQKTFRRGMKHLQHTILKTAKSRIVDPDVQFAVGKIKK